VPKAKRGEIWVADLGLAAKVRPVLVLSVAYVRYKYPPRAAQRRDNMNYRFKRTGPRVAAINWIVETSQVLKISASSRDGQCRQWP
jgi:hypothetical protein